MDIFCEKCRKIVGQVSDDKIPEGKTVNVSCPGCGEKIYFTKEAPAPDPDFENTVLISTDENGQYTAATPSPKPPPESFEPPPRQSVHVDKEESRQYEFAGIDNILREAWSKTRGSKGPIWGAVGIVLLVMVVTSMLVSMLMTVIGNVPILATQIITQLTIAAAIAPFTAGIMLIGIYRSADMPISFKTVFSCLPYIASILIAAVLINILTVVGFVILIIPGIYLGTAYMMAIPLIVEKKMSPLEAMETSRKAINKCWFTMFGLYYVMGFLVLISIIPLGVGLIWSVPLCVVAKGIAYREIFGVETPAEL